MMRAVLSLFLACSVTGAGDVTANRDTQSTDRREDLRVLDESFVRVEAAFDDASRARAAKALETLRRDAGSMSQAAFELAVAEIGAMAENGHSGLPPQQWPRRFNRLPLEFLTFDDGVYAFEAASAESGARVVTVDGKDLDAVRQAWARYSPPPAAARDDRMYFFLRSPALLHAAGIAASPDRVTLELEMPDGARVTRSFDALPPPAPPLEGPAEPELRIQPRAGIALPLYRQDPTALARYAEIKERDLVYVQFRQNFNPDDPMGFQREVDGMLERIRNRKPRYVIVDQRFNGGGDLNITRALMRGIPEAIQPEGRVFAITSGATFSAGIASVAYLKQAGSSRVTIVGRPVADDLDFWAESRLISLPSSGIRMFVSRERHNYTNGCPDPECHAPIRNNPIAIASVDPDIRPRFTFADFAAGRDPYIDAIMREIEVPEPPVGRPAPVRTQIGRGVYLYESEGWGQVGMEGNSIAIIGDEAVLVFDTNGTPYAAAAVLADIKTLTPLPIKYIVNSHWHWDHWYGTQIYRQAFPEVEVIAHERTREMMSGPEIAFNEPTLAKLIPEHIDDLAGRIARAEAADASNPRLPRARADLAAAPLSNAITPPPPR